MEYRWLAGLLPLQCSGANLNIHKLMQVCELYVLVRPPLLILHAVLLADVRTCEIFMRQHVHIGRCVYICCNM